MKRPPRILVLLRIGAFGLVGLLACGGPSSTVEKQGDFDKAVERFVEGDYRGTISRMEKIAAATTDAGVAQDAKFLADLIWTGLKPAKRAPRA